MFNVFLLDDISGDRYYVAGCNDPTAAAKIAACTGRCEIDAADWSGQNGTTVFSDDPDISSSPYFVQLMNETRSELLRRRLS